MSKIVLEFSPNGVIGRVTGPDSIVYPGVFLGLPFDVHLPRGVPVYGPDVPLPVVAVIIFSRRDSGHKTHPAESGIMEGTLPESTPALLQSPQDGAGVPSFALFLFDYIRPPATVLQTIRSLSNPLPGERKDPTV